MLKFHTRSNTQYFQYSLILKKFYGLIIFYNQNKTTHFVNFNKARVVIDFGVISFNIYVFCIRHRNDLFFFSVEDGKYKKLYRMILSKKYDFFLSARKRII